MAAGGMNGRTRLPMAILAFIVTTGATPAFAQPMRSEAVDSAYFSLSRPVVDRTIRGFRLVGRACRRGGSTLLSPQGVRLEHVSRAGGIVQVAGAYLPSLSHQADQACSSYSTQVDWELEDGDIVRACFDQGRPCPAPPRELLEGHP